MLHSIVLSCKFFTTLKKKNLNIIRTILLVVLISTTAFYYFQPKEEFKEEFISNTPTEDYWEMFAGISIERKFIEDADAYYRIPVFTPLLLNHVGKEVTLNGYYLPYSRIDSVIIISRFPNASCFFCGQAGIESVAMVELEKANRKPFQTDQRLSVKGKLVLNSSDIKKLAFVISKATIEEL